MIARILLAGAAPLLLAATAGAQAPIVGLNLRGPDRLFTSNTGSIVGSYTDGPNLQSPREIFALDLDVTATTLWGVDFSTSEYGIIDEATGNFQSMGVSTLPLGFANSMTAAPDGVTWYVVGQRNGNTSELWSGNVETGMFTQVGIINSLFVIDIACDINGDLVGLTLVNNALYQINPNHGRLEHHWLPWRCDQFRPGPGLRLGHGPGSTRCSTRGAAWGDSAS